MRQRLLKLETAISALQPYLETYLQEHGIDTSKNFRCLNPKHADTTASMTIKQSGDRGYQGYCFGCHCTLDVLNAASWIEGKPLSGKGFIEENVLYLAKKYNVQLQLDDLTQEEAYEYKTYQAYKLAADLVADPAFGDYTLADKEIEKRGWDKEKAAGWGIGTVNFSEFRTMMKKAGYEPGFLDSVDLDRENLFNNNNLLFTVFDEHGRPVGFSARNLKYNTDGNTAPKYNNTRSTGVECAIFKKGERLYGFDIAKDTGRELYIFEGQADVITARHVGIMNCCCTMGTALTDHHINLLKKHGCFNILLVFDGDSAGESATQKILDDRFSKERDFRIRICQMSPGKDPDEMLRTPSGHQEFVRLRKWSAFEWRLAKFNQEISGEPDDIKRQEISDKMIPLIVSEKNHIRQEDMAKQISRITGYELSTILLEVRRLRNEKENELQTRKINIAEALLNDIRRNPDSIETTLTQCIHEIDNLNKSTAEEDGGVSSISSLLSLKEVDENKSGDFAGFHMKPDGLYPIAEAFNEDWKKDALIFIGGSPQASKTSLCCQMAYEIADDIRNDAVCIYHSIDDSAKFIFYKFLCLAHNNTELYINHVANPNYWVRQPGFEFIANAREVAYKKIIGMMQEHKLVIKDASDGPGIGYAENLSRYYRELYPTKNIVLFIDNFHKLPDMMEITGHERIKRLSNHLKNMAVVNHMTIICTAEYRKLEAGEKPSNHALAESRSLSYDATAIIHLYNDLHEQGELDSCIVHLDEKGKVLPRIWCKFGKNKISGYEGRIFLDLYPAAAKFKPVNTDIAEQEQKERKQLLKERAGVIKY